MKPAKKETKDINEYLTWLADYANDLPDKCSHKEVLRQNHEIITNLLKVINEVINDIKSTDIITDETDDI